MVLENLDKSDKTNCCIHFRMNVGWRWSKHWIAAYKVPIVRFSVNSMEQRTRAHFKNSRIYSDLRKKGGFLIGITSFISIHNRGIGVSSKNMELPLSEAPNFLPLYHTFVYDDGCGSVICFSKFWIGWSRNNGLIDPKWTFSSSILQAMIEFKRYFYCIHNWSHLKVNS